MTETISKAFDDAAMMVKNCNARIEQLEELKEVYIKLSEHEEYNGDVSLLADEINKIIASCHEYNQSFQIRGVFNLVDKYRSIEAIESSIDTYRAMGDYWIHIRNQLGR